MSVGAGPGSQARAVGTTSLPASLSTAARARAFVVDTLRGWHVGSDALDDAELVVSELVTNAFLHGNAAEVAIDLADHGPAFRLEVAHREAAPASATDVAPVTAGADDTHGRGLAIVDVLAQTWGVEEAGGVRRVWAELGAARSGLLPAADRDAALAELRAATAAADDDRRLGDAVTAWTRDRLATSFAGVALAESDGVHLTYLSVVPLPAASAAAWARFPVATDAPAAAAYRDGRPYFHESRSAVVAGFPDLGPALAASRMVALAHLPLCDDGGPFGTFALAWEHGRELDAGDRVWLTRAADVVATAFGRVGAARAARSPARGPA